MKRGKAEIYMDKTWYGKWIECPWCQENTAPEFRREFVLKEIPAHAVLEISGLGFYTARLNGKRVTEALLQPAFSNYTKRVCYNRYPVSELLHEGVNVLEVTVGNGWFHEPGADSFDFEHAVWRMRPVLLCQLVAGEEVPAGQKALEGREELAGQEMLAGQQVLAASGTDWQCRGSRWIFNSVRLGVSYDAACLEEEYGQAVIAKGPGGRLEEQTIPPIMVEEYLQPEREHGGVCEFKWQEIPGVCESEEQEISSACEFEKGEIRKICDFVKGEDQDREDFRKKETWRLYDFGRSIAGDARVALRGERGRKVKIVYGERLDQDGRIDQQLIKRHPEIPRIQVDEYTLAGTGTEVFESDFTYKGFRYVELIGECQVEQVMARSFHTQVKRRGALLCSDDRVNHVMDLVQNSTLSNLHHTITDCPHREKNGWLGDAHASCGQSTLQFEMEGVYEHYLNAVTDSQWENGQLPCIAPTSVYGYNFQSGPTWDGALFRIPWTMYVYTGDKAWLGRWYPQMKRYMEYLPWIRDHRGICESGLGDFLPMEGVPVCPDGLMLTGHLGEIQEIMSRISGILGESAKAMEYRLQAEETRKILRREYGENPQRNLSFLASALHFGLAGTEERAKAWAADLAAVLRENSFRIGTGIFSSIYILEELTKYGYFEEALRAALQPECPGWVYMAEQGNGTLWERWEGTRGSLNHHMRSGIAEWFYCTLAGISLDWRQPGFRHLILRPCFSEETQIAWVKAWLDSPRGRIEICREGREYRVRLPEGVRASIQGKEEWLEVTGGEHAIPLC